MKGKNAVLTRTVEELTYSIAYMTLEAEEQGVDTCVIGFIGNELTESQPEIYKTVREKLDLPDHIYLITLLALGYEDADSVKSPKNRKSFEEVVSYEKFGNRANL